MKPYTKKQVAEDEPEDAYQLDDGDVQTDGDVVEEGLRKKYEQVEFRWSVPKVKELLDQGEGYLKSPEFTTDQKVKWYIAIER